MSSCHDQDLLALARGEDDQGAQAHCAGCPACAAELEQVRAELAMFQARAARAPGPPLATWHAVARRIRPARSRRTTWFAVGAAVLAAAGLLAVLKPRDPRTKGNPPPTLVQNAGVDAGAEPPVVPPAREPGDQAIDEAVVKYERAIATLERDYAARRPSLEVKRRARYDAQFAKLRGVAEEAQQAAGRDVVGRRRALKAYASYMRTLQTVLLEEEEG